VRDALGDEACDEKLAAGALLHRGKAVGGAADDS
jgi:hypothetical protein